MYNFDLIERIFGKKVEILGFKLQIYPYGLFIAIGILCCLFIMYLYTGKKGVPSAVQDFIFVCAILAIILGFGFAKLFQAFYNFIETGHFNLKNAGITAMGGFIGGALTFIVAYFGIGKFYFSGKNKDDHKKYFSRLLMVAPCCITIAHAFGRIGCLMAGCCHGKNLGQDYIFGGIFMWRDPHNLSSLQNAYYVPTQLYEALFLFALFAVLSVLYFKKSNLIVVVYLIAYGMWRIFIEFFRDDPRGAFVLGISPSQWQSIIFILGGIAFLVVMLVKKIPLKNDFETVIKEKNKNRIKTKKM